MHRPASDSKREPGVTATRRPDGAWSTNEVSLLTGIPYATLDYWERCGVFVPMIPARGIGSDRWYSYYDLLALSAIDGFTDKKDARVRRTVLAGLRKIRWTEDQVRISIGPFLHVIVEPLKVKEAVEAAFQSPRTQRASRKSAQGGQP